GGVNGAILVHKDGSERRIDIHGFFLAIGHHPNSEIFSKWVRTNEEGYIITDGKSSRTNVPGVFAAGDVQDNTYRQAITAAGSGCMAALDVERFLSENK
ncbi:MAG: thioredoxin-disulfide reductase, partial [Bacteroidia bacterium]|nr:thioredoxin-disulfide reductase [Bacteroidia bacterium]